MNKSTPLFYQDGEKLLRMRSLAKRRKERIVELEKQVAELEEELYSDYTSVDI